MNFITLLPPIAARYLVAQEYHFRGRKALFHNVIDAVVSAYAFKKLRENHDVMFSLAGSRVFGVLTASVATHLLFGHVNGECAIALNLASMIVSMLSVLAFTKQNETFALI